MSELMKQIIIAVNNSSCSDELKSIINSYGDTLGEDDVTEMLRAYNAYGSAFITDHTQIN